MTNEEMQAKWHQLRGRVKEFWGELTGDDVQFIAGQRELLIGKLEEKYGMSRAEAEQQVESFFASLRGPQN
ncbi:CsbD family protein [Geoalkalibacter halelectricus]|uniref:CsbD family protein n=1 Tax=Geoalkalibacter halelectricus TaxID=2847045 RepID=A0ABY5ZPX0_9BACT|nr:CsbD family protein [Geoalkalibacter halelectricus]MDO3377003.1 CsbD family protein [Geoalkalibacter halelectricus]UWZ81225.1 CsbD family protein [Geoalkalibacter halelectricus]